MAVKALLHCALEVPDQGRTWVRDPEGNLVNVRDELEN